MLVEKEPAFDIEVDVKAPKKIDNITNLTTHGMNIFLSLNSRLDK